jgi:hypothetical protein
MSYRKFLIRRNPGQYLIWQAKRPVRWIRRQRGPKVPF